jgi:glucose/arabinose dehydrogenase
MPSIEAGHLDHQLLNSPQGLLISVGSRCDACQEADSLRATVQLLDSQGRLQPFATGLRHLGGLAFDSATNILWANERSRLYPAPGAADELNRLFMDKDYGWPDCDGTSAQQTQRCEDFAAPALLLRNRANPMGLMTTGTIDFPLVYRHSLLLVLQGEADNRIVPAVVRVPLVGGQAGAPVPFLGGWDGQSMRPAAIHPGPDGAVYIADDINGAIYRAAWKRGE